MGLEYVLVSEPGFSVAILLDIEVLVMGGGREQSMDKYRALFNAAGLKVSKVIPTSGGVCLI